MLNRLTVKGRMYIINVAILVLFITMIMFAIYNKNAVKELGIHKTGEVMLEDQKARIQLATHSAALMIASAIAGINDHNQQASTIRNMVDAIIFEKDRSGYFFVYEGTVNVAFLLKKNRLART